MTHPVTGHSTGPGGCQCLWLLPGPKAHTSSLQQGPGLLGESRKPWVQASEQMAEKSPKSRPTGSRRRLRRVPQAWPGDGSERNRYRCLCSRPLPLGEKDVRQVWPPQVTQQLRAPASRTQALCRPLEPRGSGGCGVRLPPSSSSGSAVESMCEPGWWPAGSQVLQAPF